MSPGSRPEPSGWMMPVPVERTVPVGTSFDLRSHSTRFGQLALQLARAGGALEHLGGAARDHHRDLDAVGIRHFVRRDDRRPAREAAVVDLRLRQVERVVALDVPRRHVVGQRVAEDGAAARHDDAHLGLGGGEGGVLAAADRLARPGRARRGGLEEQLGPRRLVDLVVDAEAFLAEVGAAAVGDAGAPHLGRHDWDRQREAAGLARLLERGPVDGHGDAALALLVEPAGEVEAVLIGGGQQIEGRGEAGLAGGGDVSAVADESARAQSPLRVENLEQSHVMCRLDSGMPPTAAAARW